MKKFNIRLLLSFFFSFLVYLIVGRYLMEYDYVRTIIFAVIMGVILVGPIFYYYMIRFPMYLDRAKYDEIMALLDAKGFEQLKQVKDKTIYRFTGTNWPNKFRIVKRPYSLFIEVPFKFSKLLEKYRVDHH